MRHFLTFTIISKRKFTISCECGIGFSFIGKPSADNYFIGTQIMAFEQGLAESPAKAE